MLTDKNFNSKEDHLRPQLFEKIKPLLEPKTIFCVEVSRLQISDIQNMSITVENIDIYPLISHLLQLTPNQKIDGDLDRISDVLLKEE